MGPTRFFDLSKEERDEWLRSTVTRLYLDLLESREAEARDSVVQKAATGDATGAAVQAGYAHGLRGAMNIAEAE